MARPEQVAALRRRVAECHQGAAEMRDCLATRAPRWPAAEREALRDLGVRVLLAFITEAEVLESLLATCEGLPVDPAPPAGPPSCCGPSPDA